MKDLKVTKLMILPYLHEKAIHFMRKKANTKYFYTTIKREYHSHNTND